MQAHRVQAKACNTASFAQMVRPKSDLAPPYIFIDLFATLVEGGKAPPIQALQVLPMLQMKKLGCRNEREMMCEIHESMVGVDRMSLFLAQLLLSKEKWGDRLVCGASPMPSSCCGRSSPASPTHPSPSVHVPQQP